MSAQISWHVELKVKPGLMDAFRTLTREMIESTRSERGALIYERFVGQDNQSVHVFERYADSAAAIAHLVTSAQLYARRFAGVVERGRFTVFGHANARTKAHSRSLGRGILCAPPGSLGASIAPTCAP